MDLFLKNNSHKILRSYLLSILILLFGTTSVLFLNEGQAAEEKIDFTALKVALIMKMYRCENPEIFQAIMKTFDPVLVATVIAIESGYRVNAVSPAGARGLMQLTPEKLADWRNISKNIEVGSAYLKEQLDRFGNVDLAIAAYNAGPNSVRRHRGIPPYKETIRYIQKAKLIFIALGEPWMI